MLARKLVDPVPGIRVVRDSVPSQLESIIVKALARTPADRYATAGKFAEALRVLYATPMAGVLAADAVGKRSLFLRTRLGAAFLVIAASVATWFLRPESPNSPIAIRALLSGVDNRTGDRALDAVALMLDVGLRQSAHIQVLDRAEMRSALVAMRREGADSLPLSDSTARELAWRSGVPMVVSAALEGGGASFSLRVRIENVGAKPTDTPRAWFNTFDAAAREYIPDAVDSASVWVRRTLGEAAVVVAARSLPVRLATTASWEALELYSSGTALGAQGRWSESLVDLERAIAIDTGFALAYARIGDVYNTFDMARGIPYWKRALALSQELRLAENERFDIAAQLAYDTGDLTEALAGFTMWSRTYPHEYRAHFGLAMTLTDVGREGEAMTVYRRLAAGWPERLPLTLSRMGEALLYTNQWDSAGSVLTRLHSSAADPYWRAVYSMFEGVRLFLMKDSVESQAVFAQMVASGDPYFESLGASYLASLLAETSRPDSAMALLERSIALDENRLLATETTRSSLLSTKLLGLAYLTSSRGERGRCLELSQRAATLTRDPRRIAAAGTLLARCGAPDSARQLLVHLPSGSAVPVFQIARHLVLGEGLYAEGRIREAVTEFREAAKLDRPFAAREYLARALGSAGDSAEARRLYDDVLARPAWRYRGHEEAIIRPGFIAHVRRARAALGDSASSRD